jgi:hypothetical protein
MRWLVRSLALWSLRREKKRLERLISFIKWDRDLSLRLDGLISGIKILERLR